MSWVKVSAKGQVVIPAAVREKVGLKPGMGALVYVEGGKIIVQPTEGDPIDAMCGILNDPEYSYVEALLKDRREEREREEAEIARFIRPAGVPQPRTRIRKRALASKKRARAR